MAHFIGCLNYFHALAVVLSILHGSDAHPWLVGQVAVALCLTLLEEQALLKLMSLATLIKVRRADGSGKMAFFHGDIPHLLLMVASKDTRDPVFFPSDWKENFPSVIEGYRNANGAVQPFGAFGAEPCATAGPVAPGIAAAAVEAPPSGAPTCGAQAPPMLPASILGVSGPRPSTPAWPASPSVVAATAVLTAGRNGSPSLEAQPLLGSQSLATLLAPAGGAPAFGAQPSVSPSVVLPASAPLLGGTADERAGKGFGGGGKDTGVKDPAHAPAQHMPEKRSRRALGSQAALAAAAATIFLPTHLLMVTRATCNIRFLLHCLRVHALKWIFLWWTDTRTGTTRTAPPSLTTRRLRPLRLK